MDKNAQNLKPKLNVRQMMFYLEIVVKIVDGNMNVFATFFKFDVWIAREYEVKIKIFHSTTTSQS